MNFFIYDFISLSLLLFLLGLWGIIVLRRNLILILISIELLLLAVNFNFVVFSIYLNDILGQVFSLFILTVAAAESAIGLAIMVVYYRLRGVISVEYINYLKG